MTNEIKIGEILLGNGFITAEQLEEALELQEKEGGLLGLILVKKKFVTQDTLHRLLEAQKTE